MGRVCPPLRLTMVMLRRVLVIREGKWLPLGRDDGDGNRKGGKRIVCKIKKDVWFHVGENVTGGRRKGLFKVSSKVNSKVVLG